MAKATYKGAGVDLDVYRQSMARLPSLMHRTFSPRVMHLEGGFAGFCDSLTVFRSGELYGNQCKSQPNGTMGTFALILSPEERQQFTEWMQELGEVSIDASDPVGVADGMSVTLEFFGNGSGSLATADEQALLTWAQDVFQKLYS